MSQRPRKYNVLNILMNFHAFPSDVDGKYCFVECLVPVGAGAPPNHHAGETEAFYVVDGAVGFLVDGREWVARAGEFVPIPDGAVHAFKAVGDGPARILILNAPGHMHDAFFTGIGTPLPDGQTALPAPSQPDIPAVLAKAHETGMTILPLQ
ncbi:Cupin domain-containing protein [Pseudoxanthobacter soli DSM 19599]|uniref:Cupin domain-containing protein n=1 Tax=Pseudoxanthobacter soli DSM 19599 TaxID=1123029 RepID=A0A1M7ZIY5_9HYPH|nr:cupin domain-containing protein [Pseudoxanthobacter soli]SHO64782.1 Cupin domain-containing protein [Pseudoxanthobacter soli DSM 19599]